MLKKIIAITLIAVALMFSGCGDSEGKDRLEAQYAVDQGNNQVAIDLLTSRASLIEDEKVLLASAYMGRAGFTMIDITVAFSEASGGSISRSYSNDFENLRIALVSLASSTAVGDLGLAIDTFLTIDARTDDINFKLALAYIVKVGIMLDDGANSIDLANAAEQGFLLALSIAPADLEQDILDIKRDMDIGTANGIIQADDIDAFIALYNLQT